MLASSGSAGLRIDELTAVVLVGGRGTRIEHLIGDVPKPLATIAGQPFLYWLTSWLVGQGVRDLVFAAGHLGNQIADWVVDLQVPSECRVVSRRESSPLGTGGGVLACLDLCEELVLVVNGDTLLLAELPPIVNRLRSTALSGIVLTVAIAESSRFGRVAATEDGLLHALLPSRPGPGTVNAGMYLFRREVLEQFLPAHVASLESDLLPHMLHTGAEIGVEASAAPFIDIGVPDALAEAEGFVTAHRSRIGDLGDYA
jgi:D-glycero-alpha-D-manno-heptose 1-phosphate guanylyltransferase